MIENYQTVVGTGQDQEQGCSRAGAWQCRSIVEEQKQSWKRVSGVGAKQEKSRSRARAKQKQQQGRSRTETGQCRSCSKVGAEAGQEYEQGRSRA